MPELLNFMGEHTFLGFLMICSAYYTCHNIVVYPFKIINRGIRHLNIRKAGWPPDHLDADGDFKPEEKEE